MHFVPVLTRLENVQTTGKAKEASWDTWLGPMAINLRDLMHINLLYNASEPRTGACLCVRTCVHYVSLHYAARKSFEGMLAGVQMRVCIWTHFMDVVRVISLCHAVLNQNIMSFWLACVQRWSPSDAARTIQLC